MPILGAYPVITLPPTPPSPLLDERTLGFRSLDGTDFLGFTGNEFFDLDGVEGLDLPPRTVVREKVQGMAGSRIRDVQIDERPVFLPMFVRSSYSQDDYLNNRDRLHDFLRSTADYRNTDGDFDLVATSQRGVRTLRCAYLSGKEGSRSTDSSGARWESFGLNLVAVQPYWRGADWTTEPIYKPADVSWFPNFPPSLSSSRALGVNIPVTIPGNAASWVSIDVTGPATSVQVSAEGLSVSIPGGLSAGETATIVTNPRGRAALFDGSKDWARIAPSDRYRPLAPGDRTISVEIPGSTNATVARVYGHTLYEAWC